jgi:hypothetical protein
VTTGISAHDRAYTARLLASEETQEDDLTRPGHMVTLRYTPGGVRRRRGHTECAVGEWTCEEPHTLSYIPRRSLLCHNHSQSVGMDHVVILPDPTFPHLVTVPQCSQGKTNPRPMLPSRPCARRTPMRTSQPRRPIGQYGT